jgi:hypothetical protein
VANPYLLNPSGFASSTSASSYTVPVATAMASGDGLYVAASCSSPSTTVTGVTDTQGNTYTQRSAESGVTSTPSQSTWEATGSGGGAPVPLGTSDTITVTYSAANTNPKAIFAIGVPGWSATDTTATPTAATGASATPSLATGTLSTTSTTVLAVLTNGNSGGSPTSWGGSFTQLGSVHAASTSEWLTVAYLAVTTTTTVTASASVTSSNWGLGVLAAETSSTTPVSSADGGAASEGGPDGTPYGSGLYGAGTYGGASQITVSSADTATATDAVASLTRPLADADTATATDAGSVNLTADFAGVSEAQFLTVTDADTVTATDAGAAGVYTPVSSSDTATATDAQAPPRVLAGDTAAGADAGYWSGPLSDHDFAFATDAGWLPPLQITEIFEGFSFTHASLLGGTGSLYGAGNYGAGLYGTGQAGTESAVLYAARTATIEQAVSEIPSMADDIAIGVWDVLADATLTVEAGFISFDALAAITGLPASSSGAAPGDYYALPLWELPAANVTALPVLLRANGRDSLARTREIDLLLYQVQLTWLQITGPAYKNGVGASYAGKIIPSTTDEQGTYLGGRLEFGRVIADTVTVLPAYGAGV